MEEIKFVENSRINNKVAEIIETLKKEIIINFRPKSIILSGSFGRGEATIVEENGGLKFLSDCEITIIPYTYIFNRNKINAFESDFYERTGLKVGIWGATISFYLLFPFLNKKIKPTMENYDIKYGSKVICGKNYLERMPDFKPEDIPLWEGIRLLFNRMAEALEHFSFENPSEEMVFWTDKIVLACQDALLISLGKYHYSYRKRNEIFQNLFSNFDELEDDLPNFLNKTIGATEHKLNGPMNLGDPLEYWFDTARICNEVLRYVVKKEMGILFKDYIEFQKKYLTHPFGNAYCQDLCSMGKSLILYKKFPPLSLIQNFNTSWAHLIYSTYPLIYFGLSSEKEICKDYIDQATTIINLFGYKEVRYKGPRDKWMQANGLLSNCWHQFCL